MTSTITRTLPVTHNNPHKNGNSTAIARNNSENTLTKNKKLEQQISVFTNIILSDEKLFSYIMNTVEKRLSVQSRTDANWCKMVVDMTIQEAYEELKISELIQQLKLTPQNSYKSNSYSEGNSQTNSSSAINNSVVNNSIDCSLNNSHSHSNSNSTLTVSQESKSDPEPMKLKPTVTNTMNNSNTNSNSNNLNSVANPHSSIEKVATDPTDRASHQSIDEIISPIKLIPSYSDSEPVKKSSAANSKKQIIKEANKKLRSSAQDKISAEKIMDTPLATAIHSSARSSGSNVGADRCNHSTMTIDSDLTTVKVFPVDRQQQVDASGDNKQESDDSDSKTGSSISSFNDEQISSPQPRKIPSHVRNDSLLSESGTLMDNNDLREFEQDFITAYNAKEATDSSRQSTDSFNLTGTLRKVGGKMQFIPRKNSKDDGDSKRPGGVAKSYMEFEDDGVGESKEFSLGSDGELNNCEAESVLGSVTDSWEKKVLEEIDSDKIAETIAHINAKGTEQENKKIKPVGKNEMLEFSDSDSDNGNNDHDHEVADVNSKDTVSETVNSKVPPLPPRYRALSEDSMSPSQARAGRVVEEAGSWGEQISEQNSIAGSIDSHEQYQLKKEQLLRSQRDDPRASLDYYNSSYGVSSGSSQLMFFDQDKFDEEADIQAQLANNEIDENEAERIRKKSGRKVHFIKDLVKEVFYREKCTPDEKAELFYSHYQESQFVEDQNKEFMRAEAQGMTWNEWMESRTDEDIQREESEKRTYNMDFDDFVDYDDEDEDDDSDSDDFYHADDDQKPHHFHAAHVFNNKTDSTITIHTNGDASTAVKNSKNKGFVEQQSVEYGDDFEEDASKSSDSHSNSDQLNASVLKKNTAALGLDKDESMIEELLDNDDDFEDESF